MENFKLLQIVPSLISGGVERGTIDLSNYLDENFVDKIINSQINDNQFENCNITLRELNLAMPLI